MHSGPLLQILILLAASVCVVAGARRLALPSIVGYLAVGMLLGPHALAWAVDNDTTRLPARLHGQLLDIFMGNLFTKPRALSVLGTPIDLSEVTCDKYVVAGITDHITPWKGVYNTARLFGGDTRFVLSSSGHIQSLINPPGNPKSKFFLNPDLSANADTWLTNARVEKDTWWLDWRTWLAERSGERRPAPAKLGNKKFVANAPEDIVEEEKEKREAAVARKAQILEALERLKSAT